MKKLKPKILKKPDGTLYKGIKAGMQFKGSLSWMSTEDEIIEVVRQVSRRNECGYDRIRSYWLCKGLTSNYTNTSTAAHLKRILQTAGQIHTPKPTWMIYIPEEGHWPIKVNGYALKRIARETYLKWAERKRLPKGSSIVQLYK